MDEKILNMTIEDLELSVRSFNCLRRAGLDTVEKMVSVGIEGLCRIKNLGRKASEEIIQKLISLGIRFEEKNKISQEYKDVCASGDDMIVDSDYVESSRKCNTINCEFREVCSLNETYCVKKCFDSILQTLTPKEEKIIKLHYGIDCDKRKSYVKIGEELSITREHVKEKEKKAFRKLKHKSRCDSIKALFPTIFLTEKDTTYSKLVKAIFELSGSNTELLKTEVIHPLQIKNIKELK